MLKLSNEQFSFLRQQAETIEADHHGEKVLKLADGSFLKLFRRKRLFSSATLVSHAIRFATNAKALQSRGIPCPVIIATYRIKSIERTAVHYWPLPGNTLRQLLSSSPDNPEQLARELGVLIAELHDKGVYFRSLHLGNIVRDEQGQLGLIDISDMTCSDSPLGRLKRSRNFQHLFRYHEDVLRLEPYREAFIQGYVARLSDQHSARFRKQFIALFEQRTTQRGLA